MENPEVQKLLAQLHDVYAPEQGLEIAIGWWILAAATLLAIATGIALLVRYHRGKAYRREATSLLLKITPESNVDYAYAVNQLLKRTAASAYGYTSVAPLVGLEWVKFLRTHAQATPLNEEIQSLLAQGLYQEHSQFNATQLQSFAQSWIKQHQPYLGRT